MLADHDDAGETNMEAVGYDEDDGTLWMEEEMLDPRVVSRATRIHEEEIPDEVLEQAATWLRKQRPLFKTNNANAAELQLWKTQLQQNTAAHHQAQPQQPLQRIQERGEDPRFSPRNTRADPTE